LSSVLLNYTALEIVIVGPVSPFLLLFNLFPRNTLGLGTEQSGESKAGEKRSHTTKMPFDQIK
jgi:hypothetical protein